MVASLKQKSAVSVYMDYYVLEHIFNIYINGDYRELLSGLWPILTSAVGGHF